MRKVGRFRNITSLLTEFYVQTDIPILLSYYDSKLSLLLNISQTRAGAVHVMNAGLFEAVRASRLFSVDPDLGIGMLLISNYLDYNC